MNCTYICNNNRHLFWYNCIQYESFKYKSWLLSSNRGGAIFKFKTLLQLNIIYMYNNYLFAHFNASCSKDNKLIDKSIFKPTVINNVRCDFNKNIQISVDPAKSKRKIAKLCQRPRSWSCFGTLRLLKCLLTRTMRAKWFGCILSLL